MRYVGGKSKIARQIADKIRELSPDATTVIEPFMGGGAMTERLAQRFDRVFASDAQEDIYLMWRSVLHGWSPPALITEEEYRELRNAPPSALRGFAGFGGSFGGKFFGGYARGGLTASGEPRNHQGESARAVERIGRAIREGNVQISLRDYRQIQLDISGAVVYCDPPYAQTLGYQTGEFDSDEFWRWASVASERLPVYVSEYEAPEGWECVWSGVKRQSVTLPSQGRTERVEKLFRKSA